MIDETVSHYRILRKIGQGGMGEVFLAEDLSLGRKVALKFLPETLQQDASARKRLLREAQSAAALDHPFICHINEVDQTSDGRDFIVMEYVEGRTLREILAAGRLPQSQALRIAAEMAEALEKAHRNGIVHRDLKPANVMVAAEGHAKVMDFGLARRLGAAAAPESETAATPTEDGARPGTLPYMSPEQLKGQPLDARTDIFSFGIVLYEMLAGVHPFRRDTPVETATAILREDLSRAPLERAAIKGSLEKAIIRMLAKDAGERYQRIEDLRADLGRAMAEGESGRAGSGRGPLTSIAVLPFEDLSAEKDQEYFCDGIAEELINALTKVKGLRVVARTSAFSFKGRRVDVREIGRQLNVGTVLEGSIRKSGSRLRITAQLINLEDGYHLWSERFDREMADVLAIQDEIALAIVEHLKVTLFGDEKEKLVKRYTQDLEAYNLYLKGRYFVSRHTPDGVERGLAYLREAISKDPRFTLGYLGTAETYAAMAILSLGRPHDLFPIAKEWLAKTLEVDPGCREADGMSGLVAFWYDWDWRRAEHHFAQALQHGPGDAHAHFWYAWHLAAMKRFEESWAEVREAQSLEPLEPFFYASAVGIYVYSGQFDRASDQFSKTLELDPVNGLAHFHMGAGYLVRGRVDGAIEFFQKAIAFSTGLAWAEAGLAGAYWMAGETAKAEQVRGGLLDLASRQYVSPFCLAVMHGYMGAREKALECLERAMLERDNLIPLISILGFFPSLENDPTYQALVERLNFPGPQPTR